MSEQFDVVIIGAGPAGLAAAEALAASKYKAVVFEAGLSLSGRNRDSAESLTRGVGGAGLYSDGKFSFYPSATELWQLSDQAALREAYSWLESLLREQGVPAPVFGDVLKAPTSMSLQNGFKHYPSIYIPLETRKELIGKLESDLGKMLLTSSRVVRIDQKPKGLLLYIDSPNGLEIVSSKLVIFAGGRFGPRILKQVSPTLPNVFRRIELGVRIEQTASKFAFQRHPSTDVKFISKGEKETEQWRTFCTCRNGEVIETDWDGLRTFSGRADGKSTELSNIGINLRFTAPPKDLNVLGDIHNILAGNIPPFQLTAEQFFDTTNKIFGQVLDNKFRSQLKRMFTDCSLAEATIYGPCIEGLGNYPDIGETLKVNSFDVWIAGDATGMFRGLTAALLSGHYAGTQALKYLEPTRFPSVFIKESPTKPMTVVFSAQSKAFFYCRDAICEYVLKQGMLPLNPFRVFEYFLGDRVDRNLVRQGNNQLIEVADELWAFGPIADGVLFEIVRARQLHKPVRFFSIAARSGEIRPIGINEVVFEPEVHSRQIRRTDLLALLSNTLGVGQEPESMQLRFPLEGKGGDR